MSSYTERISTLATHSNGKVTAAEIERICVEAATVSGIHPFIVLDALEAMLRWDESIHKLHTLAGHSQEELDRISAGILALGEVKDESGR